MGRVVSEKWVIDIFDALDSLEQDWLSSHFDIHMFGKWVLSAKAQAYSEKYDFFTYHWFKEKSNLVSIWKRAHFTLMPSRFLETFGLSALDSLSLGVPVIWYQQWWLAQFVQDSYDLWQFDDDLSGSSRILSLFKTLVNNYTDSVYQQNKYHALSLFEQYTWERWFHHYWLLIKSSTKRILLVSDYNKDIWWIENWLLIVQKKLQQEWYIVEFFGWDQRNVSNKTLTTNLLKTLCNISAGFRLKKTIKDFDPDLIWWHSIHRVLWWFPLYYSSSSKQRSEWIMYHDFGLFHPFPSQVTTISQLTKATNFLWFIKEWIRVSWIYFPLLVLKWVSIFIIKKLLRKKIVLHLVPSPYMLALVKKNFFIWNNAALDVLSHFIETFHQK